MAHRLTDVKYQYISKTRKRPPARSCHRRSFRQRKEGSEEHVIPRQNRAVNGCCRGDWCLDCAGAGAGRCAASAGRSGGSTAERFGMVIGLRPERVANYTRLLANVWPGVLDAMRRNGWRNFDNFLKEPENFCSAPSNSRARILPPRPVRSGRTQKPKPGYSSPIPVRPPSIPASRANGGPIWKTSFTWIDR